MDSNGHKCLPVQVLEGDIHGIQVRASLIRQAVFLQQLLHSGRNRRVSTPYIHIKKYKIITKPSLLDKRSSYEDIISIFP